MISTAPAAAQTSVPYLLPYTISTFMGGGTAPSAGAACAGQSTGTAADALGDGCLHTSSSAVITGSYLYDLRVDTRGNLYYLESTSSSTKVNVREIDARTGIVHIAEGASSKVCATASTTYGDGCVASDGLANASGNYTPTSNVTGIAIAPNGDVYLAGGSTSVVHKISAATGIMSVVAGYISGGAGASGYTGDGGPALSASLNNAQGIGLAPNGDLYIADSSDNVIRKVTAATGIITTVVGINPGTGSSAATGYTGDGGPATQATLSSPFDVKVDAAGDIYELEYSNKALRVVYEGGAQAAKLIAATNSGTVPQIGYIYTVMGGHNLAGTTPSGSAKLGSPRKFILDPYGNIYVGDSGVDQVLSMDGTTGFARSAAGIRSVPTSVVGGGCATSTNAVLGDGCPATQATLWGTGGAAKSQIGIDMDAMGNLYIADDGNFRIREVLTGQVFPPTATGASLVQTMEVHFVSGDKPATTGAFVVTVASSGSQDFIVGTPSCTTNSDTTTDCLVPVTFTPTVPGTDTASLLVTSTLGAKTSIALTGTGSAPSIAVDPGSVSVAASGLKAPAGATTDSAGNTYVADTGNNRIVKVTTGGVASVFAGTGASGYTGDGSAATAATFASPAGVGVGPDNAVYVADTGNNAIRRIDPSTGVVTTVTGGATTACAAAIDSFGSGCFGTQIALSAPKGVAVDSKGYVAISDSGNGLIRELTPSGYVFLYAGGATTPCATGDTYGNGCPGAQTVFHTPTALVFDAADDIYIADTGDNLVRKLVAATGNVIDIAGNGQAGGYGDTGLATQAQLNGPTGVALDAGGDVYIADTGNQAVRLVNATGDINSVVGTLSLAGSTTTTSAATITLKTPAAVTALGNGRLAVLDAGNNRLLAVVRSTSSYNFGYVSPSSQSNAVRYQETSTGTLAASLPSPLFAGTSTSFSVTPSGSNGCNASQSLTPGTSCYLTAKFTPAATGAASVTLTQTATSTATPSVTASPVTIQFTGTGANLVQTTTSNVLNVPNPPYGTNIDVTTTITGASCSSTATTCEPTGTVQYYVDGVAVGGPYSLTVTAGSDVATAHGLLGGQNQGTHTIVAVYSGDSNYQGSTSAGLSVAVAGAVTATTLTLSPATLPQFAQLTLTAKVTSPIASGVPTGTVKFYAGTTLLGTSSLNPTTAVAALNDTTPATTLGLIAGSYSITAVYSGDVNFSGSTSAAQTLTVQPDAATISLQLATDPGTGTLVVSTTTSIGTAQGSTAQTNLIVTATNTVSDALTFKCLGLPQYSSCTFSPYQMTFSPVSGAQRAQSTQITLFTDVDPAFTSANDHRPLQSAERAWLAAFGWPTVLLCIAAMATLRKRSRQSRALSAVLLLLIAAGSALGLGGCGTSADKGKVYLTPTGVYTVQIAASGAHTTQQTISLTFTVSPGKAGEE